MSCIYNGVCSSLVALFLWQQVLESFTSLILLHFHTYRFFYCVIDCMFVYSMYNSVLLYVSNCFAYLGQAAVVNENLVRF